MELCTEFHADRVFEKFEVIEFPRSYVELYSSLFLELNIDLELSAYLKTMVNGKLMQFEDSRNISAPHRAFNVEIVGISTLKITYKPTNECISKLRLLKLPNKPFIFDLRLLQADGSRCCDKELHTEIGRYYIIGQYEYLNVTNIPKVLDFGEVTMNTKITKHVYMKNCSSLMAAKVEFVRMTSVQLSPETFTLHPNSTQKLTISVKATSHNMKGSLAFKFRNVHYDPNEVIEGDENCIMYYINTHLKFIYNKVSIRPEIESLHKINEPSGNYTYLGKELVTHLEKKKKAEHFLQISKATKGKKPPKEKIFTGHVRCYDDPIKAISKKRNFCLIVPEKVKIYDLKDILFLPHVINFGLVALNSRASEEVMIKNNTKFDVTIKLSKDAAILYGKNGTDSLILKLKPLEEQKVLTSCFAYNEGVHQGTFEYVIDNRYWRKHRYWLQVNNPILALCDKSLKFGMVTSESFVVSSPMRILNDSNIKINFKWELVVPDTPFEIVPNEGTIPENTCKICDVIYDGRPAKTKVHEITFISEALVTVKTSVELSIITRKLSVKFLQPAVVFKEIPLNVETVEIVKLENSSREIALFHVVEPLIPGLIVEPASGTLRPKMVLTIKIIVKIAYVLEFSFDIIFKINNKENLILPVSGNVVEPRITITPKNIYMPRVPSGLVTYVPVTIQNTYEKLRSIIDILDTGDENMFDVYIGHGSEKQKISKIVVEGGQSVTVFIKVFDVFRREYEMFIPFMVNGLLGPPDGKTSSIEFQHYVGPFEQLYENNIKVKTKTINKDICYCRITGVITVPWLEFSTEKFEIDYEPNTENSLEFTMTNVSRYHLFVTIHVGKLSPAFSLELISENVLNFNNTDAYIKFELSRETSVAFRIKFQPRQGHGRYVSTATLFLDKHLTIPYYNLTFVGNRLTPTMTPSLHRIIFPPSYVDVTIDREMTLKMKGVADLDSFSCSSKEETNLTVNFLSIETVTEDEETYTIVGVLMTASSITPYARSLTTHFFNTNGSGCDVEVSMCFTTCPLSLHSISYVSVQDNPYPYYPTEDQEPLLTYLDTCCLFLERWMFQQGFRRDLYPVIPDTLQVISSLLTSQSPTKTKGMNVSFMSFIRRIAGPLVKHIHKVTANNVDEPFKSIKEIFDSYKEIIRLIRSRGSYLWGVQPAFLLSYDQFVAYSENVTPTCNADIILTKDLLANPELFVRLSKQSWMDVILQSYKVFVVDSCFFECICVTSQPRNIVTILIQWYNDAIAAQHTKLRKHSAIIKTIDNITTDLIDGLAVASVLLRYCPFLKDHFLIFSEIGEESSEGDIIHNACLNIEAMNFLRLYFPVTSRDFLAPNYLQMLFLSVHLYVTLPMFMPKTKVHFNPPLLRTSSRQLGISPASQESLSFNCILLNNQRNSFVVEKNQNIENGKKIYINVKYTANFVSEESCVLLVHCYNKTRIFDTYIVFLLHGTIGALNPLKKNKVSGPLYRPNKVDVLIYSPFTTSTIFKIYITDYEPTIPVVFNEDRKPKFYIQRLNYIDNEIYLTGLPKEQPTSQEPQEHKLHLLLVCLSTQIENSWIWFRSEVGEFFIRVTTQARWDMPVDSLQAKVNTWPVDPCSCGESCECYRTTVLMVPHQNELPIKAMRYALQENASLQMMEVFDKLIGTATGKIIISMLLAESGTNMTHVVHILRSETTYYMSSRMLQPRIDSVTMQLHSDAMLPLPVTLPARDKSDKYTIVLTSECGMDIRTYKIVFVPTISDSS